MDVKIKQIREENKDMKLENNLLQKEYKTLKGQIDHLEAAKLQYYEEYVQGVITKDEFICKKQEIAKKLEEFKLQITILAQKIEEEKKKEKDRECQISTVEPVTKYQEITELTPKLTKELIREIVINPNGSIHIEWNFCDELKGKGNFSTLY